MIRKLCCHIHSRHRIIMICDSNDSQSGTLRSCLWPFWAAPSLYSLVSSYIFDKGGRMIPAFLADSRMHSRGQADLCSRLQSPNTGSTGLLPPRFLCSKSPHFHLKRGWHSECLSPSLWFWKKRALSLSKAISSPYSLWVFPVSSTFISFCLQTYPKSPLSWKWRGRGEAKTHRFCLSLSFLPEVEEPDLGLSGSGLSFHDIHRCLQNCQVRTPTASTYSKYLNLGLSLYLITPQAISSFLKMALF